MATIESHRPPTAIECPTCGTTSWRRRSGNYTETHYLHTDLPDAHDFDNRNDDLMESGDWECMGEHHQAPDAIADVLEERYG